MRIIAGEARGRRIEAPAGKNTRPTLDRVRENLFNMIQGEIAGRKVLDLFAGSGALAFEALSRGAVKAFLADHDRRASAVQLNNAETLGYEDRVSVFTADWRKTLEKLNDSGERFDIVFLDPPYAMTELSGIFLMLVPLLEPGALIILEHETGKKPETGQGFDCIKERGWGFCSVSVFQRNEKL